MKSWKSGFLVCLIFATLARAEEMHLKDGTVLQGVRVGEEDTLVVFRTSLGDVRVPASQIVWEQDSTVVAPPPPASVTLSPEENDYEKPFKSPIDPTMVLMPTAFTPPQGTWTFDDFELFFLTLCYSATNSTQITVGTMFPVDPSDFETYIVGLKQQLFQTPDGRFAMAATGDYTVFSGTISDALQSAWTANLVASLAFGDARNDLGAFHVAIGDAGFALNNDLNQYSITTTYNNLSFAAGFDAALTPNLKFIGEFLSAGENEDENDANLSIVNLGFRIHGEHMSVDLCGIRPLADAGDLFLYPMIKVGYRF